MGNSPTNGFKSGKNHHSKKPGKKKSNAGVAQASNAVSTVLQRAGFTREMMETKIADILLKTAKETNLFLAAEDTCNYDLIVCSIVQSAQRNADTHRLDNLLEKIFGKTVHISGGLKIENITPGIPLDNIDQDMITRAMERALKNSV